jgi:hypothetical protein
VSGRAIGCGVLGIGSFLALGLFGMWLAFNRLEGCPSRLQWAERGYEPIGTPAPSPAFAAGEPVDIGSTFIGLTTRTVWGPPGSRPTTQSADRPSEIVLDCADDTYQAYHYRSDLSRPSASP